MDFPGEPGISVGGLRRPLVLLLPLFHVLAFVPTARATFKTGTWVPLVRGTVCQVLGHVDT